MLKRILFILFWLFIGIMLIRSLFENNNRLEKEAEAQPPQGPVFFYPWKKTQALPTAVPPQLVIPATGPYVIQERYWVEDNTPTPDYFAAHFILRNVGHAKAVNIQIMVRPYRLVRVGDEDNGHSHPHVLRDDDSISLFGQTVAVSDLAPGQESDVQSITFFKRQGVPFGINPFPDITFSGEKANP